MNLREKKKVQTRNRLLEAAKNQFVKYGYDDVTIEKIAVEAEVGTGTVYNYFKNKSEIFIAAIQASVLDEEEQEALMNHIQKDKPAADILIDVLDQYMSKIQWFFSKRLARELLSAMAGFARKKNKIFDKLLQEDLKLIDQLEKVIAELKEDNIISKDNQPKVLAELVYSAFMYEYLMYLYFDEATKADLEENVQQKIKTIFKG